jgi:hypothetical protein
MSQQAYARKLSAFTAVATVALLIGCNDSPTQPVPDAITVTPSATLVQVGDSVTLSASYHFGEMNESADGRIRWTSSDSSAFIVDGAGFGHALKYTGAPVTVTATASGVSGTTDIRVLPKFDSLVVTMSATLATGRTVRPTFAVHVVESVPDGGSRFQELPELSTSVQLSSSDPATVSVASDGAIHATAVGHATITADLAGARSTFPVDVIPGYAIKSLPGTEGYSIKGVNDAGAVIASFAGGAYYGGTDVVWQNGSATDLGRCSARDVNNAGQVACEVITSPHDRPGVYSQGLLTVLLDSTYWGTATAITEAGSVFGLVRDASGSPDLFLATSSGVTIPALDPCCWYGDSYAMNSLDHAVVVDRTAQYPHSYLIGGASPIELRPANGRWAEVRDINDADDAVGWSEGWGNWTTATVWRAATNWKPEILSYRALSAVAISEAGQVVGNGVDGPFVWRAGRYTILNDALVGSEWTLTRVSAISRSGIVAGEATNSAGAKRVVLIDLGKGQ